MFFQNSKFPTDLEAKNLLEPFFYLDKSKFKADGTDGDACFKKFSNEGNGVRSDLVWKLGDTATAVRNGKFIPKDWLTYVDLFTLFSNHIDQQRYNKINPQLSIKYKEAIVLHFLEAALSLSPKIDFNHLENYKPRYLSSQAQLFLYLGKARRYAGISPEERLPMLTNALKIANYLESLGCREMYDPHAYQNRVPTTELAVCNCLQDLKKYDEAAALIIPQVNLPSAFHVTQARIQIAKIYLKKHQDIGGGIEEALLHAHLAVEKSKKSESVLLEYNARTCLMNVLQVAGNHEEATELAQAIINEIDVNLNCGAKPLHRESAQKILDANMTLAVSPTL